MVSIKKGLDLPITGAPKQEIVEAPKVKTVAVTGFDFVGMKPTMKVKEGDTVKIGQPLFVCKKVEGVVYTSPAAGVVKAINRGERRVFQSIVIEVAGSEEHASFENYKAGELASLSFENVRDLLVESGMWAALRTRPFSKAPAINSEKPKALFINAMDTNPLAAKPEVVIAERSEDFKAGVEVLSKLSGGKTYVTKAKGTTLDVPSSASVAEFAGKHPAGNVGTHIHFLAPVNADKYVWHVGYQDVIAIGSLFKTGKLSTERVVALGGPQVKEPRLLKTRVGACLCDLTEGELKDGENRVISGSVLSGRKKSDAFCYLGFFHNQVSVLREGREREFLGWHKAGVNEFSLKSIYLSKLTPSKLFNFSTTTNGSLRAMVPVGMFEKVMPLDILPTQLLRALACNDTDQAQRLGCLELDEEDLALCTFASPGKVDFGKMLRENLEIIEKEG